MITVKDHFNRPRNLHSILKGLKLNTTHVNSGTPKG
jgi:hypothetical protein